MYRRCIRAPNRISRAAAVIRCTSTAASVSLRSAPSAASVQSAPVRTFSSSQPAPAPAAATTAASASGSNVLMFYLNGKRVEERNVAPEMTLLEYLRNQGLTGSKLGCGEGGCGACTVVLSHWDKAESKAVYRSINACLAPVATIAGHHLITVEGIGRTNDATNGGMHPVQRRMAEMHGSQCGFCTPGIVAATYAALRNNPRLTPGEMEESMDGNLCRCTGYRPILDAVKSLAVKPANGSGCQCAGGSGGCCGGAASKPSASAGGAPQFGPDSVIEDVSYPQQSSAPAASALVQTCSATKIAPLTPYAELKVAELPFPEELKSADSRSLHFKSPAVDWYRPVSLKELLSLKSQFPGAKLVVGNTEIGVEARFKGTQFPVRIAVTNIPELNAIAIDQSKGITFGSSVTLTQLKNYLSALNEKAAASSDAVTRHRSVMLEAYTTQLKWFSSTQIRNGASIGGNICTASPIADLPPLFVAMNVAINVINTSGARRTIPSAKFFTAYRTVALQPNEIVESVTIPFSASTREFVRSYKQARRRDDDISIVTAGMSVKFKPEKRGGGEVAWIVESIGLGYGGVGRTVLRAAQAEAFLVGKEWTPATITAAYDKLKADFPLTPQTPGGQTEYRQSLTTSFLWKFYVYTALRLRADSEFGKSKTTAVVSETDASAADTFHRPVSSGRQEYQTASDRKSLIGKDTPHVMAGYHVTGEATYIDDIPSPANTLHMALVVSDRAHAAVESTDYSAAAAMPGFAGFVDWRDIPAGEKANAVGEVIQDETLFAKDTATYAGHIIGCVVASTHEQAKAAARAVKVKYARDLPAVTSIDEAIKANSYLGPTHVLQKGSIDAGFAESDTIVEGVARMGGQEHFYLETNACLVVPNEKDTHIYVSSQNPAKNQEWAAHVLGVPSHRVHVHVKRMGGGFGGKETRTTNFSCVAAIAARKFNRPVKLNVERDLDMSTTGGRHPFIGKYKVGFKKDGTIKAIDLQIFANGGASTDLSIAVLDRALFHSDGTYKCPNFRATGRVAKTNLPSNTAFRGFGAPQGMFMMEAIMDHVQRAVKADAIQIRESQFYAEKDRTHFGQPLEACNVMSVWSQLKSEFDVAKRRKSIDAFNRANRWRKRGLALVPTKFGISFTAKFMNQGGALVHVYADGSVLVSHGGTEMGQALHTKMLQIAAHELGVSMADVHIAETATNAVANTSPTAASMSSDINGMAILDACRQINARLAPVRKANPNASFKEIAHKAYFDRINLSAQGFHRVPDLSFDWATGVGRPFAYFTFGASASEVEIDALTGDHTVLASHVVMDLGKPINPVIDIGQIEGAFAQGQGLFTIEELIYGDEQHKWVRPGVLATRGPGAYKLPGFGDVPIDFRVSLLKNGANPRAIHSSKAVGEPPLFLASSIFFALKDAIAAARTDAGLAGPFALHSPLSSERIRMAALDQHTAPFVPAASVKSFQPFGSW